MEVANVYTVVIGAEAPGAAEIDLLELRPSILVPIRLLRLRLAQSSLAVAAEADYRLLFMRGHQTGGSGGEAVVPVPLRSSMPPAFCAALRMNTTVASGGDPASVAVDGFNTRAGLDLGLALGEWADVRGGGRLVLRTLPGVATTFRGTLWFAELGSLAPFPSTPILDAFTRANEDPLGNGTWAGPVDPTGDQLKLVSNEAVPQSLGAGFDESYWSATTFQDCEAYVDVTARGAAGTGTAYFYLRVTGPNTATYDGYYIAWRDEASGTNGLRMFRVVDGVYTELAGPPVVAATYAAGDGLGVRMVGGVIQAFQRVGASGSWRLIAEVVDQALQGPGNIALGTTAPGVTFDNFGGGHFR